MKRLAMIFIIASPAMLFPSEPTQLDRARASLALAAATLEQPHVHPDPEATGYAAGYSRAIREELPLFVYVGQVCRSSSYAVVCAASVLGEAPTGSVVVGVPVRGDLVWAGTFDGCPGDAKLVEFTRDWIRRRRTVEMSPPVGNLIQVPMYAPPSTGFFRRSVTGCGPKG